MKELEASRMNFLRQGRSALTYRTLLIGFAAWCLFLAGIYGLQAVRAHVAKVSLVKMQQEIEQLNAEKDARLKLLEAKGREKIGGAAKEDLKSILIARPRWSRILRQMTKNKPAQVWLASIVSSQAKGEEYRLQIQGFAKSQRDLTNFIMGLEAGGYFRRTELAGSKKTESKDAELEFDVVTTPILTKF